MKREHQKEHKEKVNGIAPEGADLSLQKEIALRAYELYLQRGGTDGHEVEDWLRAEREVLSKQDRQDRD
ncbi:MAG: DUF2934 domain-containing protein [Nitrospiraceae bacterium]|jgi:hypothetical protein|uniref:DUF2934 domain-containing protein n=1 Tax=Nitrospira cf. moscoviensis SBR1015 TaxID=96242 RepID=UPI000A0E1F9A|nr:DUF2934 domain-containing protein [Nitrospira cf. moscoviensis SBR1015]MBY0249160.1 DUF2934 domain-containing protein [Nitrospiraceae bacterium]OQW34353.1 MAG: hypothetical protein A4E20_11110 [Nitrospira sp. SG-bin2]